MPITDDRTPALNLPLPYADNWLEDDSERLREALLSIDTAVAGKASAASITAVNTALAAKADLVGGKIPAAQMPAYVDDVLEFASLAAFPGTGESGKIYIALDSGKTYRWGGSLYAEISASPGSTDAVPEGSSNLYFTPARAADAVPLATYTMAGKVKVGNGLGIDGEGFLFSALGGGSAMSIVEVVPVTNGLTQVGVPGEYVVGSILVAVNGAFLAPSDYTATDGIVVNFIGFTVGTADSIVIVKLSTIIISSLPPGSVGTTQLTNDGVTAEKIAEGAVGTGEISNGAVTTEKLAPTIAPVVTSINGGQLAGFRNLIINGGFLVNQRGWVSGTSTVSSVYTLDRWKLSGTPGNITFSVFANDRIVTIGQGVLEQTIEGSIIAGGQYVLSWFGTATATVDGAVVTKGVPFTLFAPGTDVRVVFSGGTVGRVQLEPGTVATPFEHRPFGVELALCQRYFQFVDVEFSGYSLLNNSVSLGFSFPSMRAAPTQTLNGSMGTSGVGTPIVTITKPHYGVISATKTGANGYFLIQRPMLLSAEL